MENINSKMMDKAALKALTADMLVKIKEVKALGYEVYWEYNRHINDNGGLNVYKTYCMIENANGSDYYGITRKNPKDCPNLKLARFISFTRAFEEFKKGEGEF